ncbi:MAG TPA: ABC-2 family transporter protein [Caldilineaceae bacterium]|nr:ABC-2 family transporter protein [Caldilineaceae bacterium]
MSHRLRLVATYFRLGALNELQYRVNFWTNLLQSVLGLATSLGGLAVVFLHTDSLAGWSAPELAALVGLFYLMRGAIRAVIQPSMEAFMDSVRKGTLDFILTKPEDAQLLVSIQRVSLWSLIDVVLGFGVLVVALIRLQEQVGWLTSLRFGVALLAGAVIVYSFHLILATCAFWFIKIENILVIFHSMYRAGLWPVSIYPPTLRFILTFLVPVAFAVTVPAEAAVGRLTPGTLLLAAGLAIALFMVSRAFWQYGIRHYSGASA